MEDGDPDRDSIPREGPYASLVPPASPWNTLGTDMRKAILHALASSTDTTTPFLVVMVLPVWEDTSWYSDAIRNHNNMQTLIQIPIGYMRFVPAHKQTDSNISSLPPAK
jgi:hypothetical protein